MSNLNREKLRKLILQEIQKMKNEIMLQRHKGPGINRDVSSYKSAKHTSCHECGSAMYEGESTCEQCGYSTNEEETRAEYGSLKEGGCGCGPTNEYESGDYEVLDYDMDDDFIPDHMHFEYEEDVMEPGEAFGAGYIVGQHDNDVKIGNHKHYKGSYMAKNHMHKTAKYAAKIYQMIPDGHNLEDWMRSKLAQISDDISEVYHALDHDIFEGDV